MLTKTLPKKKKKNADITECSYRKTVLKRKLRAALNKYARIDTDLIEIHIHDDGIILNGVISNVYQKQDADDIVNLLTKGNFPLENNLKVESEYMDAETFTKATA